jgi:hypothetical protein
MPLLQTQPGQVFFVDNGAVMNRGQRAGSDSNRGTFLAPFATLDYAINTACVSGRGDIVFVMPGHYETISNATALGMRQGAVAVIGMGMGPTRPTFVLDTATTTTIRVWGSGCSVQNCVFLANFAAVASPFTLKGATFTGVITAGTAAGSNAMSPGTLTASSVTGSIYPGATLSGTGVPSGTTVISQVSGTANGAGTYLVSTATAVTSTTILAGATDFAVSNCEFRDLSSSLNFQRLVYAPDAYNNAFDGLSVTNNYAPLLGTTASSVMVEVAANIDRMQIKDNFYQNLCVTDLGKALNILTGKIATGMVMSGNTFLTAGVSSATGGTVIFTDGSTNTGVLMNNNIFNLDATSEVLVAASSGFRFFNNYSCAVADKSGYLLPAADS